MRAPTRAPRARPRRGPRGSRGAVHGGSHEHGHPAPATAAVAASERTGGRSTRSSACQEEATAGTGSAVGSQPSSLAAAGPTAATPSARRPLHPLDQRRQQSAGLLSAAPSPPDQRITVRFGDAILAAGHTAVPNLVLRFYAALQVSEAELVCVLQIWSYWWTAQAPYPSVRALSARMGKTPRQIKSYLENLQRKKLVRVVERFDAASRGQLTNEYDFSPLIAAVVARARDAGELDEGDAASTLRRLRPPTAEESGARSGAPREASTVPRGGEGSFTPPGEADGTPPRAAQFIPPVQDPSPEEDEREEDEREKGFDSTSHPPPPTCAPTLDSGVAQARRCSQRRAAEETGVCSSVQSRSGPHRDGRSEPPLAASAAASVGCTVGDHQPEARASAPPARAGQEGTDPRADAVYQALVEPITTLAREFGDEAPLPASVTRAWRLYRASGVALEVFLAWLAEAAERTRAHWVTIATHRANGDKRNGMPYLFAILKRLAGGSPVALASRSPDRRPRSGRARCLEEDPSDGSRYTGGRYGVCPQCLCTPCDPDCATHQQASAQRGQHAAGPSAGRERPCHGARFPAASS